MLQPVLISQLANENSASLIPNVQKAFCWPPKKTRRQSTRPSNLRRERTVRKTTVAAAELDAALA
jgi:hypothetical protein